MELEIIKGGPNGNYVELIRKNINELVGVSTDLIGFYSSQPLVVNGITYIGDSITEGESSVEAFSRIYGIQAALKGLPYPTLDYNQGVGGDTTQDVLDRIATVGANMKDVADIMLGTNDISALVPVDTFKENLNKIIDYCFGYGAKVVVVHSMPPKARDPERAALQNNYKDFLSGFSRDNVLVDNTSHGVVDIATMFADETHLNIYGSLVFGAAQAEYLKLAVGSSSGITGYLSDNLFTNPELTGTGGSLGGVSTGDVADGWLIGSNPVGVDVVCSKSFDVFGEGSECQTIEMTGFSTESSRVSNLKQAVTIPASTVDDVYIATLRYKLVRAKGLGNITAKIINNVFESIGEAKATAGFTVTDQVIDGFIVTEVLATMAAGLTSLNVEFPLKPVLGDVDILIHLDKPILRKIN